MVVVALAFQPLRTASSGSPTGSRTASRAAPYDALADVQPADRPRPGPGAVLLRDRGGGRTRPSPPSACVVRLDVGRRPDVVGDVAGRAGGLAAPSGPTGGADRRRRRAARRRSRSAPRRARRCGRSSSGCSPTSPSRRRSRSATSGCRSSSPRASSSSTERTRELTASRGRIIEAGDTERRRLEAAIAREVLPTMTALRERPGSRRTASRDGADDVARCVDRATGALEALRELTRGIYPTLLTRSGLAPALTSFADRRGLSRTACASTRASPASRFPERVEAAAYFCCTRGGRARAPGRLGHRSPGRRLARGDDPQASTRRRGSTVSAMSDRVEACGGTPRRVRTTAASTIEPVAPPSAPATSPASQTSCQAIGAERRLRHVRRGPALSRSNSSSSYVDSRTTTGRACGRRDPGGGLDAVDAGEVDVHQHEVGAELARGLEGLLAGGRPSPRPRSRRSPSTTAAMARRNGVLVVHHQHTYFGHDTILTGARSAPQGVDRTFGRG